MRPKGLASFGLRVSSDCMYVGTILCRLALKASTVSAKEEYYGQPFSHLILIY